MSVLAHSGLFESVGLYQSWHSCRPIFGRCPNIALSASTPRYARGCVVGVDEIQAGRRPPGQLLAVLSSKQGLVLAVLAMSGQPIRDLWEAGRQTAPCGSASSGRHMPACAWSVLPGPRTAGGVPLLGTLALELGSQDPVVRQKLHTMFTAWACGIERGWREAMASGALPTLDPGATAQNGRVFRRRDDVSQTAAYARGDHMSRPWRHRPRHGRGGGCAVGRTR